MSPEAARRARGRRGGLRSGEVRRELGKVRRRPQVRQLCAAEFETRYRAMCDAEGISFDRRGLNSTHTLYLAQITAYRARGQGYETTNQQAASAMEKRGRGRCSRTVQRLRKRLEAMGLLHYKHVQRSGAARVPGEMDTLRVVCLHPRRPDSGANVTLALRSPTGPTGRSVGEMPSAVIPPPAAADGDPPPLAAGLSPTASEVPSARPAVADAQERHHEVGEASIRAALAYVDRRIAEGGAPLWLERRVALLAQLATIAGQDTPRIASSTATGLM